MAAEPIDADGLIVLANSIANEISTSLQERNTALGNTMEQINRTITTIENVLKELETAINKLKGSHQGSMEDKRRVQEELQSLRGAHTAIANALEELRSSYMSGMEAMQSNLNAVEQIPTQLVERVTVPLSNVMSNFSDNLPEGQSASTVGGRRRRYSRKQAKGGKMHGKRKTKKGGYVWKKHKKSHSRSRRDAKRM